MLFPLTLSLDQFCDFGNEWRKQGQTSVTWYNSHSVDGGRRSRCPHTNFFRPLLFLSQIWTFIVKVTRRFFFSSIFYFLQSDISFASCLGELLFVYAWPVVVAALTIALFVHSILSYKFLYNCYVVYRNNIVCNLAVFKPYDAYRGLINLCKTESII